MLQTLKAADFASPTEHGTWHIEFTSPDGGYSRNFEPTREKLGESHKSNSAGISLALVGCIQSRGLCRDKIVGWYSLLRLYHNNADGTVTKYEFNDDRSLENLLKWLDRNTRHGTSLLDQVDEKQSV